MSMKVCMCYQENNIKDNTWSFIDAKLGTSTLIQNFECID